MKKNTSEIPEMKKQTQQGESNIHKGQQLQETAGNNLEALQKILRKTQEKYETAISSFEKK